VPAAGGEQNLQLPLRAAHSLPLPTRGGSSGGAGAAFSRDGTGDVPLRAVQALDGRDRTRGHPERDRWPEGGTRLRRGWTHFEAPTGAVQAILQDERNVGPLLRHALDPDEVARVDRDGRKTLVVLRVPARP
jgi:hypothetical protein